MIIVISLNNYFHMQILKYYTYKNAHCQLLMVQTVTHSVVCILVQQRLELAVKK